MEPDILRMLFFIRIWNIEILTCWAGYYWKHVFCVSVIIIKHIWCCKPSCTFGRPKNLSSTWNIDMAVYYFIFKWVIGQKVEINVTVSSFHSVLLRLSAICNFLSFRDFQILADRGTTKPKNCIKQVLKQGIALNHRHLCGNFTYYLYNYLHWYLSNGLLFFFQNLFFVIYPFLNILFHYVKWFRFYKNQLKMFLPSFK